MARRKDLSLERNAIAEAGLALFRQGGLSAISTRRVAAALGASPMSLYLHVGSKQGLVDAIVERLMAGVKIDLDSEAAWTAQAEQWAHGLRRALAAHPEVMELLRGRRWAIVHCTEPLIHALTVADFEAGEAVRAVRLLTWSTLGFLSIQTGIDVQGELRDETAPSLVASSLTQLHALEGGPAPATSARSVDRRDVDALFELQTRLLIAGLAREHAGQLTQPHASTGEEERA
jgi:AcrR family transcriptional regulator